MDPLDDFSRSRFSHEGRERFVYRKGSGPAVVIMHEMPGITPAVASFARRVADRGFTVFMPSLFGRDGEPPSRGGLLRALAGICIRREFHLLAANKASPVTDWLRALANHALAEVPGRGVGAIGMCITGNFALTMALEPAVTAPVLAEPSLPLSLKWDSRRKAAVHASPKTLEVIRRRHAADGMRVIGLRFQGDTFCPPERFAALKASLGSAFDPHELPDSSGRHPDRPPHSVLTEELIDEAGQPTHAALEHVLAYLEERLK